MMSTPDPRKLLPQNGSGAETARSGAVPAEQSAAAPASPPAILSAAPSLATLMHAFRRRWLLALFVAFLGAGLAVVAAMQIVPGEYTSTIVLRILSRPPQGSLENEDQFVNVQKAQIALMKSHDVLSDAIEKSRVGELYDVHYEPKQLRKLLTTHFNEGPEVLTVTLGGDNPEAVAALLNALGEVYPGRVAAADEARIKSRITQLRRRLFLDSDRKDPGRPSSLAEQLRDKRVELAQAEQKAGVFDAAALERKKDNASNMLSGAQRDFRAVRLNRTALEAELASRERRAENPPKPVVSDGEVEEFIKGDIGYATLMTDIAGVRKKMEEVRSRATASTRLKAMAPYEEKLTALEEQRADYLKIGRKTLARKLQAQAAELERKTIAELYDKIEQGKKQEGLLEAEARKWAAELDLYRQGGPKVPPEVEALRDQVKQLEKEMSRVGDELAAMEGSLPINPRVSRHTEAFVPAEKDYSKSIKVAVAAGVGFFGLLLLGVCFIEAKARRVSASGDMHELGMRVLGVLPRLPGSQLKPGAGSLEGLNVQVGMTEAVDAIRTALLHSPRVDGARVVMVTSAVAGEGKTTLASHLAASLSRAWRKTLLIDGDLRNPAQHVQFGLPCEPGFSEALRGELDFEEAIKPTKISRLWLLPAGKVDGHSLQALTQDGLSAVFEQLKEQYDFIVIDTSPILPVPDGLMLGQQADAVLLSVMRDVSRLPAVYNAEQRLESLGIRVLGAVVIGEKTETYGRAVSYPRQE
jgi:succinoglycan biosynthesis transport protein ExoP